MTPIKTITELLHRSYTRSQIHIFIMGIPLLLYFILTHVDSLTNLQRFLIVIITYRILWRIVSYIDRKYCDRLIKLYNKMREEENHEFATLIIDGKLYTDNRIMDIIEEMGKIMIEHEQTKSD